jgi:hypothetical protein
MDIFDILDDSRDPYFPTGVQDIIVDYSRELDSSFKNCLRNHKGMTYGASKCKYCYQYGFFRIHAPHPIIRRRLPNYVGIIFNAYEEYSACTGVKFEDDEDATICPYIPYCAPPEYCYCTIDNLFDCGLTYHKCDTNNCLKCRRNAKYNLLHVDELSDDFKFISKEKYEQMLCPFEYYEGIYRAEMVMNNLFPNKNYTKYDYETFFALDELHKELKIDF